MVRELIRADRIPCIGGAGCGCDNHILQSPYPKLTTSTPLYAITLHTSSIFAWAFHTFHLSIYLQVKVCLEQGLKYFYKHVCFVHSSCYYLWFLFHTLQSPNNITFILGMILLYCLVPESHLFFILEQQWCVCLINESSFALSPNRY